MVDDGDTLTGTCSICGAWKGAFGLEPTIEAYVQHSIEALREIKRVLRPDDVCYWNIVVTVLLLILMCLITQRKFITSVKPTRKHF